MSAPTTDDLKDRDFFCLLDYVRWAENKWDHDSNGVSHLRRISNRLGANISGHHFRPGIVDANGIRGAMFKTSGWKHQVSKYPQLANLQDTLERAYMGEPEAPKPPPIDLTKGSIRLISGMAKDHSSWGQF